MKPGDPTRYPGERLQVEGGGEEDVGTWAPPTLLGDGLAQRLWRTVWWFLQKLNISVPCDSSVPHLDLPNTDNSVSSRTNVNVRVICNRRGHCPDWHVDKQTRVPAVDCDPAIKRMTFCGVLQRGEPRRRPIKRKLPDFSYVILLERLIHAIQKRTRGCTRGRMGLRVSMGIS